jgi:hypothetical protein
MLKEENRSKGPLPPLLLEPVLKFEMAPWALLSNSLNRLDIASTATIQSTTTEQLPFLCGPQRYEAKEECLFLLWRDGGEADDNGEEKPVQKGARGEWQLGQCCGQPVIAIDFSLLLRVKPPFFHFLSQRVAANGFYGQVRGASITAQPVGE